MPYIGDITWSDLERGVRNQGNALIEQHKRAQELFEELRVFADGRSDAAIATAIGRLPDEVGDLRAAILAMKNRHDTGESSGDFDAIRKFTFG